eukprot:CAMPEP_0113473546 /NCGR_PEP_ID=MMETSP0014_2-20120614/18102_1 /TAXON_ID=2857 /ORGANISM="Nitzschia sp." /LENGTH=148 /DNA_ID=CAMNT_0000366321 /DNA_START=89 /DNA_END=535 /DNA_ORIENTATION=+ /assembly_acc=CAM_ASM_000159
MMMKITTVVFVTLFCLSGEARAFSTSPQRSSTTRHSSSGSSPNRSPTALFDGDGTGGWGIGGQREMTPEEFARKGERSYFDGYKMSQQSDFISQIREEKDQFKKNELDELLGVAKIAGINVKNPSDRLNKFEDKIFEEDEDDDLDLSV